MLYLKDIETILWDQFETILLIILILTITFLIARITKYFLKNYLAKSSRFIKVDATQYLFFRNFVSLIIYLLGVGVAIYVVPKLRTLAVSLFAGAGILALIFGFASQQAFSNIISGIFIVIFKPFRVGDRIKVGPEHTGMVEDITLRHTVIRNFENKRVIIPNSVISTETIENFDIHDQKICKIMNFGISYDSDIDLAMKIIKEEAMRHPSFLDNRTKEEKNQKEPAVPVRLVSFGDSSVNLKVWVWTTDSVSAFKMECDLNKSIKKRFDQEGIDIPFPHRTITYKDKKKVNKRILKPGAGRR